MEPNSDDVFAESLRKLHEKWDQDRVDEAAQAARSVAESASGTEAGVGADVIEKGSKSIKGPVAVAFGAAAALAIGATLIGARSRFNKHKSKVEKQKSRDVHFAGAIGGALSLGLKASGRASSNVRRNSFFGASMAVGIFSDMQRGQSFAGAALNNSISNAAGYAAYAGAMRGADMGIKLLQSGGSGGGPLLRGKASNSYSHLVGALSKARGVHPLFAAFLSKETIGIGAAMATIPVAHRIIQRVIARWHRDDIAEGEATIGSNGSTDAGVQGDREEKSGNFSGGNSTVDLIMTGRVRSHYNSDRARKDLDRR